MGYGNPDRGYALLEQMTDEMDIVFGSQAYPWRVRLNQYDYLILKDWEASHRPEWHDPLFHFKDGHEYLLAVNNKNIPFVLDYRIVMDDMAASPVVELDDLIDPDVEAKRNADWERYDPLENH